MKDEELHESNVYCYIRLEVAKWKMKDIIFFICFVIYCIWNISKYIWETQVNNYLKYKWIYIWNRSGYMFEMKVNIYLKYEQTYIRNVNMLLKYEGVDIWNVNESVFEI